MSALQSWLLALIGLALLQALALLCRRLRGPAPPLGLSRTALLAWALVHSLPLGWLPADWRLWATVLDNLLIAYAVIPLLGWAALEIPARLGWWRPPPTLLLQLLGLGLGALATVLIVQRLAQLNLLGLVTTSAVATAMIGLAAQEALKDLFAGLELQLGEDFAPGDWIELEGGPRGTVVNVTWRDTCLRDLDGKQVVVPNSMITAKVVTKVGVDDAVSTRFTVGLDYAFPPARARLLLETVARQHPGVLADPAPAARLLEFQDSAIAYELQVWSHELRGLGPRNLRGQLLEQIWYALSREGQSIPYPVRDLRRQRPLAATPASEQPSLERIGAALADNPLFAELDGQQLAQLVRDSRVETYGPGELVVREGAEGDSLFLVLSGQVSVWKRLEDGRVLPVADLGVGQVFGEMTLFLNAPRSASVRASRECQLLRVDRGSISALLERQPQLLDSFAALVAQRQAELETISRQAGHEGARDLLKVMRRLLGGALGGKRGG
ncbi:MAG: cyclic nucleotide-binding domain-containing protein [Cyanobium sp.]|jgi:small-conductance mechanosensitive channel/CRP-like cAMP-binding protein